MPATKPAPVEVGEPVTSVEPVEPVGVDEAQPPPIPEGWSSIAEAELAHAHLVIEARGFAVDHPVAVRLAEVRSTEGLMDRDRFVAARRAIETAVGEQGGGMERTDRPVDPQRPAGVTAQRRIGTTAATPLAERVAVMARRMNRGTRCV